MGSIERPSTVRYSIVALTTVVAVLLYVDRLCLGFMKTRIKDDLDLSSVQADHLIGAFFWTYALGQIPGGWLADRYGARRMLTFYLVTWSLLTACMGLAMSFPILILFRLGCGLFEAGAYPACAGLIRRWVPFPQRGLASSVVSIGGRLGGSIVPTLTAFLLLACTPFWPDETWRLILIVYGLVGVFLGLFIYWFLYDSPAQHPRCNSAEITLIDAHDRAAPSAVQVSNSQLWLNILTHRGLWLSAFVQFGTNFGWLFLNNNLPELLEKEYEVPLEMRGWMASVPYIAALPMMLLGGWWTDHLTRRYGARLGRALPLILTRFVVAAAFFACIYLKAPWPITFALTIVSIFGDLGLPAIWAYCLDVGGKNVGLVLGWGNMWGNLGAAVSPWLLGLIRSEFGWPAVFATCGCVYIVIGLAALGIDATRPVVPIQSSQEIFDASV